jgi:hypothetical protein
MDEIPEVDSRIDRACGCHIPGVLARIIFEAARVQAVVGLA